jgi:hypothetical protein
MMRKIEKQADPFVELFIKFYAALIESILVQGHRVSADATHIVTVALSGLQHARYDAKLARVILCKLRERGLLERWERASAERYCTAYKGVLDRDWMTG